MILRLHTALSTLFVLAAVTISCHEGGETDPCTDVTCSGHGMCVVFGASATCECRGGYRPVGLECVEIEADGDADSDADADSDTDVDGDGDTDADGDGGGDADADGGVSAAAFCGELAEILCQGHQGCCVAPDYATHEECIAALVPDCWETAGAIVREEASRYDPLLAQALLEEGRALVDPERCDLDILPWLVERERVLSVSRGSIAAGRPCVEGIDEALQWTNYFTCEYDMACLLATLIPPRGYCTARGTTGDDCQANYHCVTDHYCDGFNFISQGRCTPRLSVGAACTDKNQCGSYICEAGRCAEPTRELVYCDALLTAYVTPE